MKNEILKTLIKTRKEYKEYISTTCVKENLIPIVEDFFDEYKLDLFAVRGYTPSFNDGDPCTHSSYHEDDDGIFEIFDCLSSEYEDYEYEDHKFLFPVEKIATGEYELNKYVEDYKYKRPKYDSDEKREYVEVCQNISFILDEIYETNYQVLFYRDKEGNVKILHEDYYDY